MISIRVLSFNGQPVDGLSTSFDELGGSIGRATSNQLVLPDPDRSISRVHATVQFRGDGYVIVDQGSNPTAVNGSPIASGREHPIKPGDQIQIGTYLLAVSSDQAAASSGRSAALFDDFDDLFGGAVQGAASPKGAPAPWTAPAPVAAPSAAPNATRSAPPAAAPAQLPDDWDLLAPAPSSRTAAPGGPSTASPAADLSFGPGAEQSLDELFGLGSAAPADPLAATPQRAQSNAPNMAGHADPLQALSRQGPNVAASTPDHVSELNTPMNLPRGAPTPSPSPSPSPATPPASSVPTPSAPKGAVFSWDEPSSDHTIAVVPSKPPSSTAAATTAHDFGDDDLLAPRAPAPSPAPSPAPPSAQVPEPRPPPAPAPPPPTPAAAAPASADTSALRDALLQGLATPGLRMDALSPELMLLLGGLLRESTRGAVELMVARTRLKQEMRAQVTIIAERENNPLKFSPSVEVALQHLLSPTSPGFMAAAPAMRDAFDDLRAHQLGVMAGMKSAFDEVLQRFDPQLLEAKLSKRSAIDSLIPSVRKARLWEAFQQLFSQLSNEAHDDFDDLFGKAFLKAYEAQLARLQVEPGPK